MNALRSLLAARPLLAHCFFGAGSAVGIHLGFFDAGREVVEDFEGGSPWAPKHSSDDESDEFWAGVLAAAATGALQGGAMRWYYPALEGFVHNRAASAAAQTAVKIAIDAAPAAVSTLGLHTVAKYFYAKSYGGLTDPDSLLERLNAIADEAMSQVEGAMSASTRPGVDPSAFPHESLPLAPESLPLDELEAIEAVLDTRPTLANAGTALVTLLNFTLIPRQFRGLIGTLQWQGYEYATAMLLDDEAQDRPLELDTRYSLSAGSGSAPASGRGGDDREDSGASFGLRVDTGVTLRREPGGRGRDGRGGSNGGHTAGSSANGQNSDRSDDTDGSEEDGRYLGEVGQQRRERGRQPLR